MKRYAKNRAILEDVVVRYDPMLDSISLTTKDPDLKGKMFNVTIADGTSSYSALKDTMMSMGVIDEKHQIPDRVDYKGADESSDPTLIPLGVGHGNTPIYWDTENSYILRVYGNTASGKSTMINVIGKYAHSFTDEWSVIYALSGVLNNAKWELDFRQHESEVLSHVKTMVLSSLETKKTLVTLDYDLLSFWGRGFRSDILNFLTDLAYQEKIHLAVSINTSAASWIHKMFPDSSGGSDTIVSIGDITYDHSRILFNKSFQRQSHRARGTGSVAFIKEGQGELQMFRTFTPNPSILGLSSE